MVSIRARRACGISSARKSSRGFTLIELLVVLAILTLLAGLVGPRVLNQLGGAKTKMTPKMNKIIGWCLLLTGAYVMYDRVIWPIVSNILQQLGVYWDIIYTLNNAIPSVVVAVLLIVFGGRLLGFGKHAHHNDTDDLPPYQG